MPNTRAHTQTHTYTHTYTHINLCTNTTGTDSSSKHATGPSSIPLSVAGTTGRRRSSTSSQSHAGERGSVLNTHTYVCTYLHTNTHKHMHARKHTHTHTCLHAHTHTHVHTQTHMHACVHTHTYTHTHTHTATAAAAAAGTVGAGGGPGEVGLGLGLGFSVGLPMLVRVLELLDGCLVDVESTCVIAAAQRAARYVLAGENKECKVVYLQWTRRKCKACICRRK